MKKWFNNFFLRNGLVLSLYMLLAAFIWIIVMVVLPQIFMFYFSFRFNWTQIDPSKIGGPEDVYTLQHYKFLLFGSPNNPDPFNIVDVSVFAHTILTAVFVTFFDLLLCYPVAYYLAHVAKGGVTRLMMLSLVVPFWINELLRAFAFRILFGEEGSINNILVFL